MYIYTDQLTPKIYARLILRLSFYYVQIYPYAVFLLTTTIYIFTDYD